MRDRSRATRETSTPWALIAVIAAMAFVAFVRLRVADVPLERDEGEYAYAGRLILEGIPPYAIAYNMKFPGTYYAYALIMAIFGRSPWGIHVGLLLVNAATTVIVFAIGKRLLGEFGGAAAAVSFAVLSIGQWILGPFAHATHFVVLAAVAGLLLLLRASEDGRTLSFFASGIVLGVGVVLKQHAVFYLPLAAALVFFSVGSNEPAALPVRAKRIGALALGSVLPFCTVAVVLMAEGVLGRFWFWTFHYARAYVSESPVSVALPNFAAGLGAVVPGAHAFWGLGALGLVALWIAGWPRNVKFVLTGLIVASFLAMSPGFYYREHYFILLLPAVALLVGVAAISMRRILDRSMSRGAAAAIAGGVIAAATGIYVVSERDYLFSMTARELSRSRFGANPFIEAPEIGKYIHDRTNDDDRIAIFGSEPEILFYADRKTATGYIYTYALMEPQPYAKTMQQEMIREIEAAHPRYVVFSLVDGSWMALPQSDQGIVRWGKDYVRQCYDAVGVMDIFSTSETHAAWDDEVRTYRAVSPDLVYTWRRKSDAPCTVSR